MTIKQKIRNWINYQGQPKTWFIFNVWKQCGQFIPQTSIFTKNFYFSIGYIFNNGIGFKCFYKNWFNINLCWHGKIDWILDNGKIWITVNNKNLIQW
jgi:hypothetical protein